CQQYDDLVFTF
nr:immunoglobulin light chain junction region [Macaca mulatta]MOX54278.1 immunoglobulin light chain junction region [Macaca mulatta]MOX55122.1 immunoglobulin light chain junction region [Macaca mulatta]MOX55544.1 immunoglobulin light chain junction region [Macaca mulatta]MOX55913.1 immunoglobulin light chain junction region [Macaca mulatta]